LAENVRIPLYGERGSKIAQKNRHMIFERFHNGIVSTFERWTVVTRVGSRPSEPMGVGSWG